MLYFIGGVSRAGKTEVRRRLLENHSISGIETDVLRSMFEFAAPELGISHSKSPSENRDRMQPYLEAFCKGRSYFDDDYVVEGDALKPEIVERFVRVGEGRAVFLGYPNVSVEIQLVRLRNHNIGWIQRISDEELRSLLAIFIEDSKWFERECASRNLPFVDVSNLPLENTIIRAVSLLELA
jgi:hypothetical protein